MPATALKRLRDPVRYSPEVADEVCERIAHGESLRQICRSPHMPDESSIRLWAEKDIAGFAPQYARARERGYERWAEEILQIADADYTGPDGTTDNALVQQARLRVDSRKWLLSKMLPKQYGDKVGIESSGSLTVKIVHGLGED
jgi:hypothetical protein